MQVATFLWDELRAFVPILLTSTSLAVIGRTRTHGSAQPAARGRHQLNDVEPASHLPFFVKRQVRRLRKYTAARLAICLVLSSLAVSSTLREGTKENVIELVAYLYLSFLAACAHHPPLTTAALLRRDVYALHLDILVFLTWIHALISFPGRNHGPVDVLELSLVTVIGVVIPLIRHRVYLGMIASSATADETLEFSRLMNNSALPQEETASWLSFITYSYLDTYIWSGRKNLAEGTHVRKTKTVALPGISYADHADILYAKSRHIFHYETQNKFLSAKIFSLHFYEHLAMAVLLVMHVFASFAAPLALQKVLRYLEQDLPTSSPAPWLTLLLIGPVSAALFLQLYCWLGARLALRVECVLMTALMHTGLQTRAGVDTPSANIDSLLTTDLANIREARDWMLLFVCVPLNIALGIAFLYAALGASAFSGLAAIGLLIPVPGWFAARIRDVERERMQNTDARVAGVGEAIGLLRMLKLFGWEGYISGRIEKQREEELVYIRKRRVLEMGKGVANVLIPVVTMLATYSTYVTLIMKQQLTAAKVFSSMAVFDILRGQFHLTFHTLSQVAAGKVSLDRVEEYLRKTPRLDNFTGSGDDASSEDATNDSGVIGFCDASFTWTHEGSNISSERNSHARPFTLRIEGELTFPAGSFTLVVGATGSGKTALLLALLGEMHLVPARPAQVVGRYNLPRAGGVAYAAQETWVLNDTIRNNILFGSAYDKERYESVLMQCALERDLEMLPAGDRTQVGEKGTTLSGGQKARVTLARAIYSAAEVLLLDDVFAALDAHTIQWIIEKCFAGPLVRGRTVILVTHNDVAAKKLATHVVRMGQDGRVIKHGPINKVLFEALTKHGEVGLSQEDILAAEVPDGTASRRVVNNDTPASTLANDEELREGRVNLDAVKLYMSSLGGKHYILFFATFVGGIIVSELLGTLQTWFLGYWAGQYDGPEKVNVLWYLGVYGGILALSMAIYMAVYVAYINGGLRASRIVHRKLVSSVIGTTFRWLDVTPSSRIISRCTQDIGAVDGVITGMVQWLTELTVSMLVKLGAIVLITPLFLAPGIAVALFSASLCQIYMGAQLTVKREMANSRAPILAHFSSTMAGLVSVRAFGAQEAFVAEAVNRINRYARAARTFYNLTRWITIRLDFIGALFTSSLAVYLVYFQSQSASNTGFSLNMSIAFSGMILYWVMFANELEVQGTSLERIQEYLNIDQERKSDSIHVAPAYWPASGDLRVENLSARYSAHGVDVLHNLTFNVKAGEYVGIVGRTGSGKSSLTLALLRAILTSGHVYYDNIRTDQISLDSLRSNITIIPQVPEMLAGTLRQNLDPLGEYDDAHLNEALRSVGLYSLQGVEGGNSNLSLDTTITAGGSNVSIGQRQILALARAIIRNSKLLILDEATSAIDHETDALIQSTIRHQLGNDVTVLVVAHRLNTVMDADKIMVLEDGHLVEFDCPQALLRMPNSSFAKLVESSRK